MKDFLSKILRILKIKALRILVKINEKIEEDRGEATADQVMALKIVKRMMLSPESEMMIAPISGTYYIQRKEVFAKMDDTRVQLINGKYFYDIALSKRQSENLIEFFRYHLELRRKAMEKKIMEKTMRSLNTILLEIESEDYVVENA